MSRHILCVVVAVVFVLAACQTATPPRANAASAKPTVSPPGPPSNTVKPTPASSDAGVLLKGWASKDVLDSMTDADRAQSRQTEARALTGPIGQLVTWKNPATNHSGSTVPLKDSYSSSGAYCREFQQTVLLGAVGHKGSGVACQQHDGKWVFARVNRN